MPLSPAVTDPYSTDEAGEPQQDSVPAEYEALMAALLALLLLYLTPTPGIPVPDWAQATLWRLPLFLRGVQQRLDRTTARVRAIVSRDLAAVTARGGREAASDARWGGGLPVLDPDVVRDVVDALTASHRRVRVTLEDAFRRAVTAAQQAHPQDPVPAIQRVLDELAARGVTGFVDRAGRRWNLGTYVETTVRARYAEAALAAYVDVSRRAGARFASISVNGSIHMACRVWEGRNVSLDGSPAGVYEVSSPAGRQVRVVCAGTLEDSRAAGVWHPWCRHWLTAVVPGGGRRTRRTSSVDREARARRRYLARMARSWDRRQRVALTDTARARAAARHDRWVDARRQQPRSEGRNG